MKCSSSFFVNLSYLESDLSRATNKKIQLHVHAHFHICFLVFSLFLLLFSLSLFLCFLLLTSSFFFPMVSHLSFISSPVLTRSLSYLSLSLPPISHRTCFHLLSLHTSYLIYMLLLPYIEPVSSSHSIPLHSTTTSHSSPFHPKIHMMIIFNSPPKTRHSPTSPFQVVGASRSKGSGVTGILNC